ncbi:MAG: Ku protein [Thermoplasmata archaeon]|nr:Ku protein [Thermoplasmata archaeon]
MRALWKGSISFGLVNIPVKIYSTAESRGVKFRQLCSKCNTPIKMKKYCPNHGDLDNSEVVLGYEIEKGKFVIVEEEEIKRYIPKKTDEIKIVEFVDRDSIDEILRDKVYYVIPESGGVDAYFLLQYVLDITNKAAIGKFVMRNKEYIGAIIPYRSALILETLHYKDEVRDLDAFEILKSPPELGDEEIELAKVLINKLYRDFKIDEFKDEYTEKLIEAIKAKARGELMEVKIEEKKTEKKNLIELLKASVE